MSVVVIPARSGSKRIKNKNIKIFNGKPIIYYCAGLPPSAKFNLMLARSGIKVCTSFEELQEYIGRCLADGCLYEEPYSLSIE